MSQDLTDRQRKILEAASEMDDTEQGGPVPAEAYMGDLLRGEDTNGAVEPTWLGETPEARDKAARNAAARIQTKLDPLPDSQLVGVQDVRDVNPADLGKNARIDYGDPREDVTIQGGFTRGRRPGGGK